MPKLPIALVLQLAAAHAPQVAPETIASFAQAESALNPLAIHDNTTRRSHFPRTPGEAAALARDLLGRGHSIDAGLMQINSLNFGITGLTPDTAFDPAMSIKAGAQVMVEAYRRCEARGLGADPLRCMASIYNTGRPTAGERNGYVDRVWAAADHLVPAIRQAVPPEAPAPPAPSAPAIPHACGPPPPAWDGMAVSDHRQCVIRAQAQATQQEPMQ